MRASLRRGIVQSHRSGVLWSAYTVRSDEYCPNCDNHFVLDAVTPKASLQVEGEDVRVDARYTKATKANNKLHPTYGSQDAQRRSGARRRGKINIQREGRGRSAGLSGLRHEECPYKHIYHIIDALKTAGRSRHTA